MPPARGLSSRTHRRPLWVADMSLPPCVVAEASAEAPHSGCIFRGLRTCSQAAWGTSDPTALKAQRLFECPCGALTTRSPEAPPRGPHRLAGGTPSRQRQRSQMQRRQPNAFGRGRDNPRELGGSGEKRQLSQTLRKTELDLEAEEGFLETRTRGVGGGAACLGEARRPACRPGAQRPGPAHRVDGPGLSLPRWAMRRASARLQGLALTHELFRSVSASGDEFGESASWGSRKAVINFLPSAVGCRPLTAPYTLFPCPHPHGNRGAQTLIFPASSGTVARYRVLAKETQRSPATASTSPSSQSRRLMLHPRPPSSVDVMSGGAAAASRHEAATARPAGQRAEDDGKPGLRVGLRPAWNQPSHLWASV